MALPGAMGTTSLPSPWTGTGTGTPRQLTAVTSHPAAPVTSHNARRSWCPVLLLFVLPWVQRVVRGSAAPEPSSAGSSFGDSSSQTGPCQGKAQDPSRRLLVALPLASAAAAAAAAAFAPVAFAADAPPSSFTDMPALRGKDYGKTRMKYPDYTETPSGLQYKDLREGTGATPKPGDLVVIDWDGFTIGYYGRIFEARNKAKGGSFEIDWDGFTIGYNGRIFEARNKAKGGSFEGSEKDFFRFRVGAGEVIPAFEEAIATMQVGAVRRLVVPPELGYPDNDFNKKGPRPLTFSGQRALDFVLKNQGLIDKTLLFDIELLKVLPS